MLAEGIVRIDFLELGPDATGLIDLTEMTERGSEHGAREIRAWHQEDPLPQLRRGCFVLAGKKMRDAEQMEILLGVAGFNVMARSTKGTASSGRPVNVLISPRQP